eukprot:GFKZ01006060.1.p1 GENE.GFKZ01006060.1~~GFKZ01006060.1.p1  ORF type:complete len:249 (+),score=53.86 GFKZ01006060.1:304-1050(+)
MSRRQPSPLARSFRGPSASPSPRDPAQLQQSLAERSDSLVQRIAQHDQELLRLRHEIRGAKKGGGTEKFYKKRAAQVLKQKRSMEKRLEHTMNMQYNMATTQDAIEEAALVRETEQEMGLHRVNTVGPVLGGEDINDLLDDVRENIREVDEVTMAFAADVALDDEGWDEEEMVKELEEEVARNAQYDDVGERQETEESLMKFIQHLESQVPAPNDQKPTEYIPPRNRTRARGSASGARRGNESGSRGR